MKALTWVVRMCLLISIIGLTGSCKESFTGLVTFKTTIVSKPGYEVVHKDYVKKYGDTLNVVYCANGDMIRYHLNPDDQRGLDYQWYNADQKEIYFTYLSGKIDTFKTVLSLSKISERRTEDETIAGIDCKCYEIHANSQNTPVKLNVCYPKNKSAYWLKPKRYKGYQDYYLHKYIRKTKVPYFKYHMEFKQVIIKYDGVKIVKLENPQKTLGYKPVE